MGWFIIVYWCLNAISSLTNFRLYDKFVSELQEFYTFIEATKIIYVRNFSISGVFLHVLADTLGSVGVIISSILIENFGWNISDPICSIFIASMILLSVLPLLKETALILLLRTPLDMEDDIINALEKVNRVFILIVGTPWLLIILILKFELIHFILYWSAWKLFKRVPNSVDPDQMPQDVASDLVLHCLLWLVGPNTLGYNGKTVILKAYVYDWHHK